MKKIKAIKVWAMILTVCMCINMLPSMGVFAADASTVYEVNEPVEAEKGVVSEMFTVEKDSSAGGKRYILASEGRNIVLSEPQATYKFNVTEEGEYEVWFRTWASSGGKDTFFARIDNGQWLTLFVPLSNEFVWNIFRSLSAKLAPGEHTIDIACREPNLKIDRVLLTNNAKKALGKEYVAPSPTPTPPKDMDIAREDIKLFEISKDGSLIIEAEDMTLMEGFTEKADSDAASGKKAVRITSSVKEKKEATLSGFLSARIKAVHSGSYKVWVRAAAKSLSNEGLYASVNDKAYSDFLLPITGDDAAYQWVQLGKIKIDQNGEGTIRLRAREAGSFIDQIILVYGTGSFVPDGIVKTIPPVDPNKIAPLPSDKYPKPTITPPPSHPRVLFTAEDIPTIRENLSKPQNKNAYDKWQSSLRQEVDGKLPDPQGASVGNYSSTVLTNIEAKAFDYAINGNAESGRIAVNALMNLCDTISFNPDQKDVYRPLGHTVYVLSEVYDWCYDLLTSAQKNKVIITCIDLASQMEIGWPPSNQGPITGHGSEPQLQRDLLAFAIATYDEQPSFYNYIAGRYLSQYLEPRNYWFATNSHHQGFGYFDTRYSSDIWGYMLIEAMSGEKVIENMGTPIYYFEYSRLPNGGVWAEGDGTNFMGVGQDEVTYKRTIGSVVYAATVSQDPYIKYAAATQTDGYNAFVYSFTTMTPVQFLIYNDPDLGIKPISELPTSRYFAEPNGTMIAKTGWEQGIEAPIAAAYMRIGGRWAGNHHHLDAGTFQIYYKGMLAPDLGQYDAYNTAHDKNFDKETIAHNGLLIYDPNEMTSDPNNLRNSGGQTRVGVGEPPSMEAWMGDNFVTAEVLGQEIGPDPVRPDYSYISGDIAPAYTDKVSEVRRSMVFFNNDNKDIPALFFVMDKITAKNKSFKKTFILNSVQEPVVEGNTTTIVRNTDGYNGKLVNQTLYPTDATITPVGGPGKQWWIIDKNYPPNGIDDQTYNASWGRIEVSPGAERETDYLLNAMYVTDADKTVEAKAELIEGDTFLGARLDDTVAIFAKDKARLESEISFDVTGEGEKRIFVAGIKEGGWSITKDGAAFGEQVATEDGGTIYFKGEAGRYTISYANPSAKREVIEAVYEEHEGIMIKVDSKYMYTDVAPTIIDGRTLVPMRAIFEKLEAEIEWDGATSTVTGRKDGVTVKLTIGDTKAYVNDAEVTLDVPAMLLSERTMVPVRFVSEALGAKVKWDELSRTIYIEPTVDFKPLAPNGVRIVGCEWSSDNGEAQNGHKAYDQDETTRWAAEGVGEWIVFELENEVEIASYYTHFLNASRIYKYELYASVDGMNFTHVVSTQTMGESEKETRTLETPVKAKYIKLVGKANSQNAWNSLHEIEFRTK